MSVDWGMFSIALVDIVTGKFISASVILDLVQRDNLINSVAIFKDGSSTYTGNQNMGGYELQQVGDVVLSTGQRLTSLFQEDNMIGSVVANGCFTAATSGAGKMVITDSTKDFSALGVAVGDLVNIPSWSENFMFIVSAVGTTTLDLVNSVDETGATVYGVDYGLTVGTSYSVHNSLSTNEWFEFSSGALTTLPLTLATGIANTDGRFIKCELRDITEAGASEYIYIDEFGDMDALDIRVVSDTTTDGVAIFYMRNILSGTDNIVLSKGAGNNPDTGNAYCLVSIEAWQYNRL